MKYSGGWEVRDGRTICRWFVAYTELESALAGIIGGYSGGGGFIEERFYAEMNGSELTALWIDYTEQISGAEKEFDQHPDGVSEATESALDLMMEFHDEDTWFDDEQLVLNEEKTSELTQSGDMLIGGDANTEIVKIIAGKAGLTAAPA